MALKCFGTDAVTGAWVEVTGERGIQSVEELISDPGTGTYVAPGFIDLQVNGYAGADYCNGSTPVEMIAKSLEAQFACGVTRLLPTVITGGREEMLAALRNLARARAELPYGRAMEGFHVEGPHISPEDGPRGAHPRHQVRPPDIEEYKRWQEATGGRVKLVTVAAEWPGVTDYIEHLVGDGVVVALGHMNATGEQIRDAARAGATLSTHLGNGAHAVMSRHPNYLWEQMVEDRLAATLIVDGIHLGAAFLKTALRAKGLERCVLITDAVMPAGCAPGPYMLGEVEVELHAEGTQGKVTLRGGDRLAGSALRMDRGIENLMRLGGLTLSEAVTLATRNAARVGRIPNRQRGLQPGERSDVVEFAYDAEQKSITVLRTWLEGELVYRAN